MSQPMLE